MNEFVYRQQKTKRAKSIIFCPLCRSERKIQYRSQLTPKNYMQIFTISLAIGYALFPLMQFKVIYLFFFVWMAFEASVKVLFRKQVPCPDCGFDATWYRRDVKIAREKVKQHFATQAAKKNSKN
jgi:hypothetical protein